MDGFHGHGGGDEGDLFEMINGGGIPGFMGGGGGLFSQMFGGAVGGRRRPRKGETTVQPLSVTLEDLYKGKMTKLQLTKKALCKACNGVGGKADGVKRCEQCHGSGRTFITRQIGPGMIQQMAAQCDKCHGEGEIIDESKRCKTCLGRKTVQEQKIIEVKITPGMRENRKIVFYGEGDQEPGIDPGDVVLVVKTKPHEVFERKDDDLFMKKTVTLKQALCGFTTVIKHLDGTNIVLSTGPGEAIQPESIRGAIGKGMPRENSPLDYGNLYIIFDVKFPKNYFLADEQNYKKLEALLPPRPHAMHNILHHEEEVSLSDFDTHRYEHHSANASGPRQAYQDESSEDEMPGSGGAQHVQCAQQ